MDKFSIPSMLSKIWQVLCDISTKAAASNQADWNEADDTSSSYIKNKPTIPAAQIQSDWNQADNTKADFIKNKPTIPQPAQQVLIVSGDNDGENHFIPDEGEPSLMTAISAFLAGTTILLYVPQNDDGGDYMLVDHYNNLSDELSSGSLVWSYD